MLYGAKEYDYAAPFADRLVRDAHFRQWVIGRTRFADLGARACLLHEEMLARRSKRSQNWWRSHFTERCRCAGCSGQETDLLAIFEDQSGFRFARHFEVKQPSDRFPVDRDQAGAYALRAQCWAKSPPPAVLPHADAATVLLCSGAKLGEYAAHLPKFDAVITFDQVRQLFPQHDAHMLDDAAYRSR